VFRCAAGRADGVAVLATNRDPARGSGDPARGSRATHPRRGGGGHRVQELAHVGGLPGVGRARAGEHGRVVAQRAGRVARLAPPLAQHAVQVLLDECPLPARVQAQHLPARAVPVADTRRSGCCSGMRPKRGSARGSLTCPGRCAGLGRGPARWAGAQANRRRGAACRPAGSERRRGGEACAQQGRPGAGPRGAHW